MGSSVDAKITTVQRWSVMGEVMKPTKITMKKRINSLTSLLRAKSMPVTMAAAPAPPLLERECADGACSCSATNDLPPSSKCSEERSEDATTTNSSSCAAAGESCCSNPPKEEDAFNVFAEVCSMFDKNGIKVEGLERHRSLEKHKAKFILGEDDIGPVAIAQEKVIEPGWFPGWLLITGLLLGLTGILSGLFLHGNLQ